MYSMTLRNEPNMTNTVNIGNKQKHLILLHRATVQRDLISVSLETADFPSFSNNFLAAPKTVEGPPRRDKGHSGFNGCSSFNGFGNFENTDNYQTAYTDHEYKVDLDMYTALLGGEILIQTPKEKLKLKIKPGTQPGSKVRLKGKGDQYPDGTRGNLILVFNVTLPKQLSERQKELLEQMRHA